jgi:hypothetical protein
MSKIRLQNTTGNSQVDRILQEIVGLYETVFPGYIRAYYVIGSDADGSLPELFGAAGVTFPFTQQAVEAAMQLIMEKHS